MSQFGVYCCEIDMDFAAPGLWHLRQKKETKEKRVCCVDPLATHSVLTMCTHTMLILPQKKKLQSTLLRWSNNDQIERKSIPALKHSHLWGSSCRSEEYCGQLDVQREVLEKKACVIYICKEHESLSHLIPSYHILTPSRSWTPLRGWKCRVWWVDLGCPPVPTKPLHRSRSSTGQ